MFTEYSQKELEFIEGLRDRGTTWKDITSRYNKKFKQNKTLNAIRKTYKRYLNAHNNFIEDGEIIVTNGSKRVKRSKKYVITSYIPGSTYNKDFLKALDNYAKKNRAEVCILSTSSNYAADGLDESLIDRIVDDVQLPFKINNNLLISEYKTNINIIDPISGLESLVSKQGSLIVPGPRHRMKMVPRMLKSGHAPRAVWCTGTISNPYYKQTKSGLKCKEMHLYGAIIVEVINREKFFIRQLTWDGVGFYDLGNYYTKTSIKKDNIECLSLGDDHAVFLNKKVLRSTVNLIKKLNPEHIFHHDTLDCASVSHHVEGKYLTKANIPWTLKEEGKITSDYLQYMCNSSNAKHYLVASNHPEHLTRYLDECRYRDDYPNHNLAIELAYMKINGKDPIDHLLRMFNPLKKLKVLKRKDSVIIKGIENADHGDEGANGSRGTPLEKGLSHNGNITTGHTHTAEIGVYGNYVNGTSTHLSLNYTKDSGSSSWINAHTIQYKNGTRAQFFIMPTGESALK